MVLTPEQIKIIGRFDSEFSKSSNLELLLANDLLSQIEMQDLYTLEEVAMILKKSIVTIRYYVREGHLKAIKKWRNWMIPSNEVARLLYEKRYGKKLEENVPMLVILNCMEIYNDETKIEGYRLITSDDLFKIVDDSNFKQADMWDKLNKVFLPSCKSVDWVDAVCNIPHFFRRTGDLPFQQESNNTTPLSIVFNQISVNNISGIPLTNESVDKLLNETPQQAIKTIIDSFCVDEDDDTLTPTITLRLYKAFLEVVKENQQLKNNMKQGDNYES